MNVRDKIFSPRRRSSIAVAGLAIGLGFAAHATAATAQNTAQSAVSQNWSGYSVVSQAGQSFSSVSGSWVQPSVSTDPSASASDGSSAFWVGLGGATQQSQSLEQIGTAADVQNGQASYYAWYELLPAAQQRLDLPVRPGDHMTGRVSVNGTTVTLSLSDQTTGQSVTKTLAMDSPDVSSAEWIAEAPAMETAGGAQILPLADFGQVSFSNASATAGGHTGSITDAAWSAQKIDLSSAGSQRFPGVVGRSSSVGLATQSGTGASPSDPSSDGSGFSVSTSSGTGAAQSGSSSGTGSGSGYPSAGNGYPDPGAAYAYGDPGGAYGYGSGDPGGPSGYGYGPPGGGYGYAYPGDGYAYVYPGA
jgi:Peptidase A4 family